MPLYPLKCPCGRTVDVFRNVSECDDPYPCECGSFMSQDYSRKSISSTPFFEGAYIFKDGKKQTLATKDAIREHCARNNLVVGADDIEQESEKNRKDIERKKVEHVTNKVMEDFTRRQKTRQGNKK